MPRRSRRIGAGITWLSVVSGIVVPQLHAGPVAAETAIDCDPTSGRCRRPRAARELHADHPRAADRHSGRHRGRRRPRSAPAARWRSTSPIRPSRPKRRRWRFPSPRSRRSAGSSRSSHVRRAGRRRRTSTRRPAVPTPNLVVTAVGTQRRVCVFANEPSDVIVDLAGWWSDGPDRYASITPVRGVRHARAAGRGPPPGLRGSQHPARRCAPAERRPRGRGQPHCHRRERARIPGRVSVRK